MSQPATSASSSDLASGRKVAFLGPLGTFTEQALKGQADLAVCTLLPLPTMPDVLDAVRDQRVDLGFVAIENAIEGTVNVTLDALLFDHSLVIQREVVLDIEHCLMAVAGTTLADVKQVFSIPVATAQCHAYLRRVVPHAELRAANSTAEAARMVGERNEPGIAAVAPRAAAELYGLDILAADIADHPGNQTRFVVVARSGVPAPTGHDKTSLLVFQRANAAGSLLSILQEFAARRINLTNLLSRPAKTGLGDYCFFVEAEGHIADEVLADALRDLHAKQGNVKFLGSYPAAGASAESARAHADAAWTTADDWVRALRDQIVDG